MMHTIIGILLLCLSAGAALPHDGHAAPQVLITVETVQSAGNVVDLALQVTNLGPAVTLQGVLAQGARAADFAPVVLEFAGQRQVQGRLVFESPPPGIFSAWLDFGPAGQGPVIVVPGF